MNSRTVTKGQGPWAGAMRASTGEQSGELGQERRFQVPHARATAKRELT